jgi:hypothetical protein
MLRPRPLLGAAVVYGASRAGARRGMEREMQAQQEAEYRQQQQTAAYEAQRDRELRQRAEDEKRRNEELEREKEKFRMELELERARNQNQIHVGGPAGVVEGNLVFCTTCGNNCKTGDAFCSGCGTRLPALKQ